MSHPSLVAVPAALALALTCTVGWAQDKSTSTTAAKPVTTLSKAASRDTQKTAAQPQDATARKARQEADKAGTAAAQPVTPPSERSYEGCHHAKDSDA